MSALKIILGRVSSECSPGIQY